MISINTIHQANNLIGKETLHPLITVIKMSEYRTMRYGEMKLGLYGIFLKVVKDTDMQYGRNTYDYQDGTLMFIAPGQTFSFINKQVGEYFQPTGWALMFDKELLMGTSLERHMDDYSFFAYSVYEALHTSVQERDIVIDCLNKINFELQQRIDNHSKTLLISNIELLLNYCKRFYERQFITRENANKSIVAKFNNMLNSYFESDRSHTDGIPSVGYCADKLHLSANYLGDLIKKEIGSTAQDYIQSKVISLAKEQLKRSDLSVTQIAYLLGFKYPHHFMRLFKQKVGTTPKKFRAMN